MNSALLTAQATGTKPYMATQIRRSSSSPVMVAKRAATVNTNELVYERLQQLSSISLCQQSSVLLSKAWREEDCVLLSAEKSQKMPRFPAMAHSSASSSLSTEGTDGRRKECLAEFNPADHFAQQSRRSARMAGKCRTREQFRRNTNLLNDLLLLDHCNVQVDIIERSIARNQNVSGMNNTKSGSNQ